MRTFTDQLGRSISIPFPPKRIISLVPSQTELLADLGLDDEVVGITKFCVHPVSWYKSKDRVGGTKTIDIEKVAAMQPDLIIANQEENGKEQVEALAKDFPVWVSDVNDMSSALDMVAQMGEMTNRTTFASNLITEIEAAFSQLQPTATTRVAYLIWREPYMVAGGGTYIDDMLQRCGFENVFADRARYPKVTSSQLQALAPELILLSSEPYPFKEKHLAAFKDICPQAKVMVVDGEMFSWYGSRMRLAAAYFNKLLALEG